MQFLLNCYTKCSYKAMVSHFIHENSALHVYLIGQGTMALFARFSTLGLWLTSHSVTTLVQVKIKPCPMARDFWLQVSIWHYAARNQTSEGTDQRYILICLYRLKYNCPGTWGFWIPAVLPQIENWNQKSRLPDKVIFIPVFKWTCLQLRPVQ